MKTLLNLVLLVTWISLYLGVVYVAGRYRRTRARVLGVAGPNEFRAEKDVGVWFVILVTGVMLGAAAFFAARVLEALP